MRNLKTIEGKVRAVLQKDEEARNDDMLLYLKVCNGCLKDTGAMPFAEVIAQYKYLGLPSFESVCSRMERPTSRNRRSSRPRKCRGKTTMNDKGGLRYGC